MSGGKDDLERGIKAALEKDLQDRSVSYGANDERSSQEIEAQDWGMPVLEDMVDEDSFNRVVLHLTPTGKELLREKRAAIRHQEEDGITREELEARRRALLVEVAQRPEKMLSIEWQLAQKKVLQNRNAVVSGQMTLEQAQALNQEEWNILSNRPRTPLR